MKSTTLAGMAALLFSLAATAAPVRDPLRAFLRDVDHLSATFEQVQADEDGKVLQRSSGRLWLARPAAAGQTGRFRWSYEAPYPQLMVCDGKTLWMHDPDLEQVTKRPAGESLQGTPAQLLTDRAALDKHFRREPAVKDGASTRVRLTPRNPDSDFRAIELWFAGAVPQRMRFIDPLGGSSEVRFSNVRTDAPVDAALFEFQPPKGVEIIEAQ